MPLRDTNVVVEVKGRIMRRMALVIGLVLAVVLVQGCIVIHSEEEVPCGPKTVGVEESTIREIDAVTKLAFENDRKQGYLRIARREGLSDTAQVHLIEAAMKHLDFENGKVEVLMAMVARSDFSAAAEAAVLDRVSHLAFEHNKRRVLEAISDRKG